MIDFLFRLLKLNKPKVFKAVIVESRNVEELFEIIQKKHLNFLDQKYELIVFLSKKNIDLLNGKIFDRKFEVRLLEKDINSLDEYNTLLTSIDFWESLNCDKALIFQADSEILRKGIEEFEKYDWVGAPWPDSGWSKGLPWINGSNGGLSLRSVGKMIKLLKKKPYKGDINEDGYFSLNLSKVGGKVAPREVCMKFSVESVYTLGSFGLHAANKHFDKKTYNKLINQYK